MNIILSFVLSVAAGVVSNCISKWLDGEYKDSKHELAGRPALELQLRGGSFL